MCNIQKIEIPVYLLPFGSGSYLLFNPPHYFFFLKFLLLLYTAKLRTSKADYFWKAIKANTLIFMLDKAVWYM